MIGGQRGSRLVFADQCIVDRRSSTEEGGAERQVEEALRAGRSLAVVCGRVVPETRGAFEQQHGELLALAEIRPLAKPERATPAAHCELRIGAAEHALDVGVEPLGAPRDEMRAQPAIEAAGFWVDARQQSCEIDELGLHGSAPQIDPQISRRQCTTDPEVSGFDP